jgi:hypothetical protein
VTDLSARGYIWKGDFSKKSAASFSRINPVCNVTRRNGDNGGQQVWGGMWHGFHDTPDIPEAEPPCD